MKTFNKLVRWLIGRTFFAALVYYGVVLGMAGPRNVMIFLCWIMLLISMFAFTTSYQKSVEKAGRGPIPAGLSFTVSMMFAVTMVWHGFWVTSIVYAVAVIFIAIGNEAAYSKTGAAA